MTRHWFREALVGGMAVVAMLGLTSTSSAVDAACGVTGGGSIEDTEGDTAVFGGSADTSKDGTIGGHWHHSDLTTGAGLTGRPQYIVCRHVDEAGPGQPGGRKGLTINQVFFGGPAEWRDPSDGVWAAGYFFDVVVKDHGGVTADTYDITVRLIDFGVIYHASGEVVGGKIQIHP